MLLEWKNFRQFSAAENWCETTNVSAQILLFLSICVGIKDNVTGNYIINLPSWSRTVYYQGTQIRYTHEENMCDDSIELDGPTTVPLRVVVSV